ncbi:MAG: hypothetical protein CM15mP127_02780 [Gammaproteobacteria bacterium]|nr:MAG: hypothetical protein CM15mP127_02780 [Gammaproteobacteria bacterium]
MKKKQTLGLLPHQFKYLLEHRFEKWSNFPNERAKLLSLLSKASSNSNLLIVSGDRHRGGIYKKDNLIELTSSSMNKPSNIDYETDQYLDVKHIQRKITASSNYR